MRSFVIVLAGLWSGCQCRPPNPCIGGPSPGGGGGPQRLAVDELGNPFLSRHPLSVTLPVASAPCATPTSAVTTVDDPANDAVPSTGVLSNNALGAAGWSVIASFDAGGPGWYQVKAQVEPDFGITQAQVLVLDDRQGAFSLQLAVDHACGLLQRTAAGTWVCDGNAPGVTGDVAGVSGNAVWSWSSFTGTLARWVDADAGVLALAPDAAAPLPGPVSTVLAGDGDAVVAWAGGVTWFAVDAGSLTALAFVPLQALQPPVVGVRDGGVVFLASLDGGLSDGGFLACALWLAADGGVASPPCQTVPGNLLGTNGDGLWVENDAAAQLTLYAPAGLRLVATASASMLLPSGFGAGPESGLAGTGGSAFVTLNGFGDTFSVVPAPRGGDVVLQLYEPGSAFPPTYGVSSAYVWEPADGGLKVFVR